MTDKLRQLLVEDAAAFAVRDMLAGIGEELKIEPDPIRAIDNFFQVQTVNTGRRAEKEAIRAAKAERKRQMKAARVRP